MDAIKSYLENMFLHLPKTPDVIRAKDELSQMMEDKYNQLRSEGHTDNEAVGQVIAEFGNLGDLAENLGIGNEVSALDTEPDRIEMTDQDVERYFSVNRQSGRQIAGGVGLVLAGVALLILLQTFADMGLFVEKVAQAIGLGGLLLLIAIAVYMFIVAGVRLEKYESMEKKTVIIDPYLRNRIKLQKEEYLPIFGRTIAAGVFLILLGVILLVTVAVLELGNDFILQLLVVALLAFVAIGTALFIMSGIKLGAYDKLLNEGDYTMEKKANANYMESISAVYWMLVLAGYLAWSFIGNAWDISWIVWPIAGVLFAVISNLGVIINKNRQN